VGCHAVSCQRQIHILDELNRRLIDACCCLEQSIFDEPVDQCERVSLHAAPIDQDIDGDNYSDQKSSEAIMFSLRLKDTSMSAPDIETGWATGESITSHVQRRRPHMTVRAL